jgi:hypothetical protein
MINWNGKMTDVPNWENMYYLPTSCGTLLFTRYKPNCGHTLEMETRDTLHRETKIESFDDTEFNFSHNDTQDNARTTYNKSESLFALVQIYPPTYPVKSIAEEFIIKKHQKYWENVVKTLEGTQSILEIVPFVASARAFAQSWDTGWWEHKPLITAADRLGFSADLLLDTIPVLAQAKKLRKVSKQMYVYGSVGLLSAAMGGKMLAQGELKIDDFARLIVLAIVVRGLKKMPLNQRVDDAEAMLKEVKKTQPNSSVAGSNDDSLSGFSNVTAEKLGFKWHVREKIRRMFTPFKIDRTLDEEKTFEALVKGFKLDELPPALAQSVISEYKVFRKMMSDFSRYLAMDKVVHAEKTLKVMGGRLIEQGKKIDLGYLPESKFPLQEFLDTPKIARTAADARIAKLAGEGATDTAKHRIYIEELRDALKKLTPEGSPDPTFLQGTYNYETLKVDIYKYKFPTLYYVKGKKHYPYEAPYSVKTIEPGNKLGPNGEEVKSVGELGNEFQNLKKHLESVTLQTQGEEIQHAMNHFHNIISPKIFVSRNWVRREVTGTGFPHPIKPTTPDMEIIPVRFLSQNPETVNCYEWARTLPETELRQILAKYNKTLDINQDTYLRDIYLDSVEMDIFFSYHKTGVVSPKSFNNEYISRILAMEYIARGMP